MTLPPTVCTVCRGPILPGHRVGQVWVVRRVVEYAVQVEDEPEAAHADCADPAKPWRHLDLSRAQLKLQLEDMRHRLAPSHQCAKCGEPLRARDRIVELFVVEGAAVDPSIGAPAIQCAGETEYAHHTCPDRDLSQGRSAIVLVKS